MTSASAGGMVGSLNVSPSRRSSVNATSGELVDGCHHLCGNLEGHAGRPGEVPTVHEAVERHEPGERRAGQVAERRRDRAIERSVEPDRREEVVHGPAELGGRHRVGLGSGDLRWLLAPEHVGEGPAAHDHVVQHVVYGEVGARGRAAQLVDPDAIDRRTERGQDVGELFGGFHERAFRVGPAVHLDDPRRYC